MMKDEDTEGPSTSSSSGGSASNVSDPQEATERVSQGHASRRTTVLQGRSCTGCLYHSSHRNDSGRNPLCVGFSRSEKKAYKVVGDHPQFDAMSDGKRLLEFRYACLGYSVYEATGGKGAKVELPACIGIEVQFLDPRKAAQSSHVPSQAQEQLSEKSDTREEAVTPPILPRPPTSTQRPQIGGTIRSDEFVTRFFRTAGLIATAVGNNLTRVAGSIKTGLDDIFYPDRRRPK